MPEGSDELVMLRVNPLETTEPHSARAKEGPQVMQVFIVRHAPFFILVAVLLAQLLLLALQVTSKHNVPLIKVWAVAAFDPFERSFRGLADGASGAWYSYHDLRQAERENIKLKQQLAEARARILQLSQDGAQNERLRALLGLQQRLPLRTLGATVIAASPGSGSAIYIDKGEKDGLRTDLPVITPEGVVGKIIAVFNHTAQVLIITDGSSGVGSMLEKSDVQGVLKGGGDGVCHLDYIMNGEKVEVGDGVVTSGLDQIYPKGLLVGTVVKVSQGNIYKNITVKPAAALDRLEDVLVILNPSQSEKAGSDAQARR
jgi:rod shape-determining protein MreC